MKLSGFVCSVCEGFIANEYGHKRTCDYCAPVRHKATRAASAMNHARVKAGVIPRADTLNCSDCGKPATGYDHRDYAKLDEVQPVCKACNVRRGPGDCSIFLAQ